MKTPKLTREEWGMVRRMADKHACNMVDAFDLARTLATGAPDSPDNKAAVKEKKAHLDRALALQKKLENL